MRARSGLGVILDAEHRMIAHAKSLQRLVVKIGVRDFHLAQIGTIRVDREAVIVRSDLDLIRQMILHRVIGAAVAELHFISLAAHCQAQNLVAETDTENRYPANEALHVSDLY